MCVVYLSTLVTSAIEQTFLASGVTILLTLEYVFDVRIVANEALFQKGHDKVL